jgi:hypothetical protein
MPAIVVCAACQTKLKVPDGSPAKALRCPKCKGIVPIASKAEEKKPDPPKPKVEEEFEVNEAVDESEEEFEVNEAVDEEESEVEDEEEKEDPAAEVLAELGFGEGEDPFKIAEIPDEARKAFKKQFAKKEKVLWAGRPVAKIIESKAWIGLVVGGVGLLVGLSGCIIGSVVGAVVAEQIATRILAVAIGAVLLLGFGGVGLLAILFRKRIGGNVNACYVLTNKRAYIGDGASGGGTVRAFTAQQLGKMSAVESTKFAGAGDLIFGYEIMGQGVAADKDRLERLASTGHDVKSQATPFGFLSIEKVSLVKQLVNEVLIAPLLDEIDAKKKRKREKERQRTRPSRPFGNS